MNIFLPSELEQYVEREVASGRFRSETEAVEEALWLLRRREEFQDRLRLDIQVGIDQLERGEYTEICTAEEQASLIEEIEMAGDKELGQAAR